MPRLLKKIKIFEVSAVDCGAGVGVPVMLMTHDQPTHEQSFAALLKIERGMRLYKADSL
jgi:hypothetical protein